MANRVVVTGMGVVSALGTGLENFSRALLSGECAVTDYEPDNAVHKLSVRAAPVREYKLPEKDHSYYIKTADKAGQMAVGAAFEAMQHAHLDKDKFAQEQVACIIGSTVGGQYAIDRGYHAAYIEKTRVPALTLLQSLSNAPASLISIAFGTTGPAFTVSSACASAAHAISVGYEMVKSGSSRIAITGGTEASLTYGALSAWRSMKILSPTFCRPFCASRDGLILGEGAGMLILEEMEFALARGAPILAELVGVGMSSDALDMVKPSVDGGRAALEAAIGTLDLAEIANTTYINAHGTGTRANDIAETSIVRSVFGDRADDVHISSTKSMHGHLLGAAGGVEAIASICALRAGRIPPTINFETPDPQCDLNYTPNSAVDADLTHAISNSFGFGGMNAILCFERWRETF